MSVTEDAHRVNMHMHYNNAHTIFSEDDSAIWVFDRPEMSYAAQ
ncbi:hypothetical protein CHELA40_30022 [Chelatococcus asaccharovorans]|nr:hypothetical protein CHELA40_30022 [Chelatococcus asaccharovorans]